MRWVREAPRVATQMAQRHLWLFIVASVAFWTLLSPLALVWLGLRLIDRHRELGKSAAAKRQRRVTRLLRWYPADWRARYGDEMAQLLDDTIAEHHASPRLRWNVAKEGIATRLAPPARRQALAGTCLGLCWLPLVPQGLVAAVLKSTGTPTRSWFVALYVWDPVQWPLIAIMIALGLAMLSAGITLTRRPATPLPH